jgi:hypothetical protein
MIENFPKLATTKHSITNQVVIEVFFGRQSCGD